MPYEIIGEDIYDADTAEYVGAVMLPQGMRRQPAARPNMNAMRAFNPNVARQILGNRQVVNQAPSSRVDETPLPITATAVAGGASATIAMPSQIIFAPRRLIVPDSIAPFFTIDSISVGNVPLYAGTGSIPAEAFRPDSVAPNLKKVTAQAGVPITVIVTNVDGLAHTFRGAIFGEGVQPQSCG